MKKTMMLRRLGGSAFTLRKLVLALAATGVVGAAGGGGYLYLRAHSPGHLTAKGSLALDQGDSESAIHYLQQAMAGQPKAEVAIYARRLLAKAYLRAGREEDGRAMAREALAASPNDPEAVGLLADSYVYGAYRRFREARKPVSFDMAEEIGQLIEKNIQQAGALAAEYPQSPRIEMAKAQLHRLYYLIYNDQAAQARNDLEAASDQAAAQRAQSRLTRIGEGYRPHQEQAIAELRAAMGKEPGNATAAELLAEYALDAGHYADVLELARQMQERRAETPELALSAANAILFDTKRQPTLAGRLAAAREFLEQYNARHPKSPRTLVALGQIRLEQADLEVAKELAHKALEASPGDLDALLLKANALLRQRQAEEALQVIQPLTNQHPNVAKVWQMLGMANSDVGNYQPAEDAYRKALSLDGSLGVARRGLMLNYVRAGNLEAAARLAPEILREDRYYMPAWQVQVEAMNKSSQAERSRQMLQGLAADPALPAEARPELVRLLAANGLAGQAEQVLEGMSQEGRGRPEAQRLRATVLAAAGRTAEARGLLAEAVQADPKNAAARLDYAEVLLRDNLPQDARAQYDQAVEQAKESEALLRAGQGYLELRLPERAANAARRALELSPKNVRAAALLTAANRLAQKGTGEDAAMASLMKENPPASADLAALAQLAIEQKDYARALQLARTGLGREPNQTGLRVAAAQALAGMGQTEAAAAELAAAARQQPQDLSIYETLVGMFATAKEAPQGIAAATNMISYNPVFARYAIARLALIQGDTERSLKAVEEALGDVSRAADTRTAKQLLYTALLAATSARQDDEAYRSAVDRVAGDPGFVVTARLTAADHYLQIGQNEAAKEQLEHLAAQVRLENQEVPLVVAVAQRWSRLGEADHAIRLIGKLPAEKQNAPAAKFSLASLYQQKGQNDKALAIREALVKEDPSNPTNLANLAFLRATMGDFRGALQNLGQCEAIGPTGRFVAVNMRVRLYEMLGLLKAADDELASLSRGRQSDDYQLDFSLGQAWMQLKKPEEARERLAAIPPYASQYVQGQIAMAMLDAEAGRVEQAVGTLRKLVEQTVPYTASPAALPLFQILRTHGKADEALHMATEARGKAVAGSPAWMNWTILAAAAARDGGRYDQAVDLLHVLQKQSDTPSIASDIAMLELLRGRTAEASAAAERLSDQAPGFARSTLVLLANPEAKRAWVTQHEKELAGAPQSTVLAALAAIPPGQWSAAAERGLGGTTVFKGDLLALSRQLQGTPEAATILSQVALAQRLLEADWPLATIATLNETQKRLPTLPFADALRYRALQRLNQQAEAESLLAALRQTAPEMPSVRLLAAQMLLAKHEDQEALAQFKMLVQGEPHRADLMLGLGQIHERLGQLDQAIALARAVRTEFPEDPSGANNLAYLLVQAHPTDPAARAEARRNLDWALKHDPGASAVRDTAGWLYVLEKQPEKALPLLSQALLALPLQPAVHYHIGMAYAQANEPALARLHLENVAALADPRQKIPEVGLAQEAIKQLPASVAHPLGGPETRR